jgi:hypothetical protein
MSEIYDPAVLEAFVAAVNEIGNAEEFERLMLDKTPSFKESMRRITDGTDCMILSPLWDDEEMSALELLKRDRALKRLKGHYPEVWERVAVEEAGIGA